jgi:2-polyprenyl-6-methoxyphenol hydroxylase-like FAD-dependent oxidoreductase
MTPTLAFGANTALESVAALANNLNQIVSHASEKPSTETLEDIFTAYKTQRYSRAKRMSDITGRYTRLGAWDGMGAKFSTQYMVKILGRNLVLYMMGLLIKGAVKLDYIPTKERKAGTVQWDDEKTPRGWLSMAALYDPFVILATALTICRPYYTSLIPKARSTSGSTESLC